MEPLSARAARGVALAALAVACVVVGPTAPVVAAMERVYAVGVLGGEPTRRSRDRVPRRSRTGTAPRGRGPAPARPAPT